MQLFRKAIPFLGLVALGLMVTVPAMAQSSVDGTITLDGTYEYHNVAGYVTNDAGPTNGNYPNNNGVLNYIVTPTANFYENANYGLAANNSTVTVNGGEFDHNYQGGLFATGSTVIINGGEFVDNVGDYDAFAIESEGGSSVSIYGGTFTGNEFDFYTADASITLYGNFVGLSSGSETLGEGSSTFTGTLENGGGQQTFNYLNYDPYSSITLVNAPVAPEPSQWAVLTLLGLGLPGLMLLARKRRRGSLG